MNAIRGDESEYKVLLGILRIKDKTVKIKCYQKFGFHNYKGAVLLCFVIPMGPKPAVYLQKILKYFRKIKFLKFSVLAIRFQRNVTTFLENRDHKTLFIH